MQLAVTVGMILMTYLFALVNDIHQHVIQSWILISLEYFYWNTISHHKLLQTSNVVAYILILCL